MKNIKKNNGFTLVELLAVIVIFAAIMLIALPSITSSVDRNKKNTLESQKQIIATDAGSYAESKKNSFSSGYYAKFTSGTCCIYTDQLKSAGVINDSDLKDNDGNTFTGYVCKEGRKNVFYDSLPSGKVKCLFK